MSVSKLETRTSRRSPAEASLAPIYASIQAELGKVQRLYRQVVKRGFGDADAPPSHFKADSLAMIEDLTDHILLTEGKWVRAAVVLLSHRLLGGTKPDQAVHLAVAIELIHAATLLHDDIIDEGSLRRGEPCAQRRFGNTIAVLLGDLLFSESFGLLNRVGSLEVQRELAYSTMQMCLGELVQEKRRNLPFPDETQYLEVIGQKTAGLFRSCARCAGLLAEVPPATLETLGDYGYSLGVAFQIIDDLLDVLHPTGVTGKDQGNDLKKGKITLAGLHYIRQYPEHMPYLPEDEELTVWRQQLLQAGSIAYARDRATEFGREAKAALHRLHGVDSSTCQALDKLVDFVLARNC